jgi:hypothetical protein
MTRALLFLSVVSLGVPVMADTLFAPTDKPSQVSDPDPNPVELGVKVWSNNAGSFTAVRFYKGPNNAGPHTARVWDYATKQVLATATFSKETGSGWQEAPLSPAVPVTAGTTYVISYHAPRGYYSVTPYYFQAAKVSGSLNAPNGANGVYAYGSTPAFPDLTYQNSNYWVDVAFTASATPTPSAPAKTSQSVSLGWTASPTTTVTGYRVKYGTQSGNYPLAVDAGNSTSATVTGLARNVRHFFVACAYDSAGNESVASNEVSF